MPNQTHPHLKQAYELIKQRDFLAARPLVLGVIKNDTQNQNAWWLATYIAQTPPEKRAALNKVLKLNPSHTAAKEMLRRLEQREHALVVQPPAAMTKPKRPMVSIQPSSTKKQSRTWVWVFRIVGFLCFWGFALVMVDNFLGGQITKPWENLLGIEPEASVFVAEEQGGLAQNSENAIPITDEFTVNRYGEIKLGILRQDEAQTYRFNAVQGTELLIAVNFTAPGDKEVVSLELWDTNGRLVGVGQDITSMAEGAFTDSRNAMLGSVLNIRGIQYTVPVTGEYRVVLVSRPNGAKGQYGLYIAPVDAEINTDANSYLPDGF